MSGGIDSSVTALLLAQQGYQVIGITMKTWDYASISAGKKETGCCNLDSIHDARSIAVEQGFPHYILDIRAEFNDSVIDNFVGEYMAGRTPNPCVLCNTHIKWDALIRRADMLGCKYIATGHYAQIRKSKNRYILSKGKDALKDQSYVLWGLSQEVLSRTMFPVGAYTKKEIRALAAQMGFEELSKKKESYEICFIPDNDYRSFIKNRLNGTFEKLDQGTFVDKHGTLLGHHDGYPFFTVGQRKGLQVAFGKPMYVTAIHPLQNRVVLGELEDLHCTEMFVRDLNLIKYHSITEPLEVVTKIRYKDQGALSTIEPHGSYIKVSFHADVKGIAPGQSAVFYENNDVIGGGFIARNDEINKTETHKTNE